MAANTDSLERIDSFPYRRRIADVMSKPVRTAEPSLTVALASRRMLEARVGSLVVVDADGTAIGIVTEHDVMRALGLHGGGAANLPLADIMSRPVATVPEDAFLFVAFGRMPRLGVNHLLVVDSARRPVGMLSAAVVMRLRSSQALVIGDEIGTAGTDVAMAAVWKKMPVLARALLAEGVAALDVTAVVSAMVRDLTARAAELAVQAMAEAGWGAAPAPWCLLVLGSAGRGESAFSADQDNALVHTGNEADDAWFAELGRRIADTLDAAGIPYCKGGVMAKNREWRRSLAEWRAEIERWIRKKEGENLLNVDIFFDFAPVTGDRALAEALRKHATAIGQEPLLLRFLAEDVVGVHSPLRMFGWIRTEHGRFDIKRGGLFPIAAVSRMIALKQGIEATSTTERLARLATARAIGETDASHLRWAYGVLMGALLDQQLADVAAGTRPSTRVEPGRLSPVARKSLRRALRQVDLAALNVQGALRQL